ncbi:hypothetical protein C9417_14910 [Rhizobium sp. SEMIA 4088]|nr:hypothetical protein C9417_14910 [Rhizobium sp. SEMIA 4088]
MLRQRSYEGRASPLKFLNLLLYWRFPSFHRQAHKILWLAIRYKPPLDGIGSFKVNGRRCGGDWTRRGYEGWFSIRNRIWIQGVSPVQVARREGFCAGIETAEKIYAGTGGNKLLILYLVFAATITTRYRKDISG